jgi:hypothetical protein
VLVLQGCLWLGMRKLPFGGERLSGSRNGRAAAAKGMGGLQLSCDRFVGFRRWSSGESADARPLYVRYMLGAKTGSRSGFACLGSLVSDKRERYAPKA